MTRSRRLGSCAKSGPRADSDALGGLLIDVGDERGEAALPSSIDSVVRAPFRARPMRRDTAPRRPVKQSVPCSIAAAPREKAASGAAISAVKQLHIVLALCALAVILIAAFGFGPDR